MKFIKQNLTLVICGLVVLLSAAAAWYFKGPAQVPLKDQMSGRLGTKATIVAITNTDLSLPGTVTSEDGKPLTTQKGPPSERYVQAKDDANKRIAAAMEQVQNESKIANRQGRVDDKGIPLLPLPPTVDPPKSVDLRTPWGRPMPNYLPKLVPPTDANAFKEAYRTQFSIWTCLLAQGTEKVLEPGGTIREIEPDETIPPRADKIAADYQNELQARRLAAQPGAPISPGADQLILEGRQRQAVLNRASDLRMYVEPAAFQIRAWRFGDDAPTDQQVFEAFIDSWCQADIVRAIMSINNQAIGSPTDRNISKAPIKRLIHITLGSNARARAVGTIISQSAASDPGPIFYTAAAATATPGNATSGVLVNPGAAGQPGPAAAPNAINFDTGMTGQFCGGDYDVVMMSIWMDIDPAYINRFMDELYKQNMGYAEVNRQFRTVNPLDRVSNGYIYGEGPVVEVQIQVQAILFRSWTQPIMPDATKALLGIPITPDAK